MANVYEPSKQQRATYERWVSERPSPVRVVAERVKPWKLYKLRSSGHLVVLYSFDEHDDGTVTLKVDVTGRFNALAFERRGVGIDPDDIEECDLPGEDDLVGTPSDGIQPFSQLVEGVVQ